MLKTLWTNLQIIAKLPHQKSTHDTCKLPQIAPLRKEQKIEDDDIRRNCRGLLYKKGYFGIILKYPNAEEPADYDRDCKRTTDLANAIKAPIHN